MKTIHEQLARFTGIGPGFDFLRIALAVTIVCFHSQLLTNNLWIRDTPAWFLEYGLVPMFFSLSGFLVTASGIRLSLKNFLINRGLRIAPALGVDIVIAAMVIGPLVTAVPLKVYFTDHQFFTYFWNLTGYIHYALPGVFEDHINTRVNGALWTVPYEIMCYVITSFFIVTLLLRSVWRVLLFTAAMIAGGILFEQPEVLAFCPVILGKFFRFSLVSREAQIVTAFLFGMVAYQLRDFLPYSKVLFITAVAICTLAAFGFDQTLADHVAPRIILLPALAYITIFIGLTPIPIPKYFHRGDYSYGIYLYHDPILQVMITLFPAIAAIHFLGGIFIFVVGLPVVMAQANFSWHFIEKPILGMRKKFSFVAKVRGVDPPAVPSSLPVNSEGELNQV